MFKKYFEKNHIVFKFFGIKIKIKCDYAYLKFSYSIERFKKNINNGKYSVNIGDYVQSVCIKKLLQNKLKAKNIVSIDRDTLSTKFNKFVRLFCNGVFYNNTIPKFPVKPIYLGLCFTNDPNLTKETIKNLKTNEPIGCRDLFTKNLLKKYGIKAFVSGCYSLTLEKRKKIPKVPKVFFVGISDELKKHIPPELLKNCEFITQRTDKDEYPLSESTMKDLYDDAENLLERYKNEATLVVSPLLHCISPCIAMGIPVILARDTYNKRFSAIEKLTRIYIKEEYDDINWNPKPINVEKLKNQMIKLAKQKFETDKISNKLIRYFNDFYKVEKNTMLDNALSSHLNDTMEQRIAFMYDLIKDYDIKSIMDVGCGKQNLRKYLKDDIEYYPVDAYRTKAVTIIRDFNNGEFFNHHVDCIFLSGILEYIYDVDQFISNIAKNTDMVVGSYIFSCNREKSEMAANNFSQEELFQNFEKYNFHLKKIVKEDIINNIGKNTLFVFEK